MRQPPPYLRAYLFFLGAVLLTQADDTGIGIPGMVFETALICPTGACIIPTTV